VFEQELQPESLRLALLFSSVSGRFGNAGQVDYAAANEVLVRWAWLARQRWPSVRSLAVCWGPWQGAGMAGEGVLRGLRERGILPIHPDDASRFLLEELRSAGEECEVIAGEGFWRQPQPEERKTGELLAAD